MPEANLRDLGVRAFFAVLVKDGETEIVSEIPASPALPDYPAIAIKNAGADINCLAINAGGKGIWNYVPDRRIARQAFMGYLQASVREGWTLGWLGPHPMERQN